MSSKTRVRTLACALSALVVSALVAAPASAATTAPTAPRALAATSGPDAGRVDLRWLAPTSAGGSAVLEYGVEQSVDAGTTWSGPVWLGSTALSASSTVTPDLTCRNSGPTADGRGCRYRIRARNAVGAGNPSNVVTTWVAPGVPRTFVAAPTDDTLGTVTLSWLPPTVTGAFGQLVYPVEASFDGGPFEVVDKATGTLTAVPCTGARSCTYRVAAVNGQGPGPAATTPAIVTMPGRVQSLAVRTVGTDLGAGVVTTELRWQAPTTGLPATSYLVSTCQVPAGTTTGCTDTSPKWSAPVALASSGDLTGTGDACPAGVATCFSRVAAVNERGGAGKWRTVDLRPWAPFGVGVAPGPRDGEVTITYSGPAESGDGPNTPAGGKSYRAFACVAQCDQDVSWRDTGLVIPYPPSGTSPFTAGTFACGGNVNCLIRMQFTAGDGNVGPLTPTAAANGLTLSVTTPTAGTTLATATPTATGTCTIGAGKVTATFSPGPVAVTVACGADGRWSAAVPAASKLADGPASVVATQAGTVGPAKSGAAPFVVDTTAPIVTVVAPGDGATVTTGEVGLVGTCSEAGLPVSVALTGAAATTITADCAEGKWSAGQPLPDGSYTVAASQRDAVGNLGTGRASAFTVKAATALVTVQTPTDGADLGTDTPAITGLCTTAAGTVTVTADGATLVTQTTACAAGAWSIPRSLELANGRYEITATQTALGVTLASSVRTVRIDTVAPTTTDDSATVAPTGWTNTAVTVTLSPVDPDPASGVAASYVTTDGSTPTTASTRATTVTLTTNGTHTLRYFSVDAAGNAEAVRTAKQAVRIDTVAPTVATTFAKDGARYNQSRWNSGCGITGLCGTAGDAASGVDRVHVTVRRLSDSMYWDGSTWTPTATVVTATGTTSWSLPMGSGALSDGISYRADVQSLDAAGNRSAVASATFTYDTTTPKIASVSATNGNWAVGVGDTFTATFTEAMDPATVPTTATLTLRNSGGDCSSVVTYFRISGLMAAERTTGSCGYIKGTGSVLRTITWDGTLTVSGSQVIFTVTSACTETGCANSLTSTPPSTSRQKELSFAPVTTITDRAGNANDGGTVKYCRAGSTPCGAPF